MKTCPNCSRQFPEEKKFCSSCGAALSEAVGPGDNTVLPAEPVSEKSCPSCGEPIRKAGACFCPKCGHAIAKIEIADTVAATKPVEKPARRFQLTLTRAASIALVAVLATTVLLVFLYFSGGGDDSRDQDNEVARLTTAIEPEPSSESVAPIREELPAALEPEPTILHPKPEPERTGLKTSVLERPRQVEITPEEAPALDHPEIPQTSGLPESPIEELTTDEEPEEVLFGQGSEDLRLPIREEIFEVETVSPLSASKSKKGDRFSVRVLKPDRFLDWVIEGEVASSKASGKVRGKSELHLAFDSLVGHGQTIGITADLTGVQNSQGVADVDEEGHVIGRSSKKKDVKKTLIFSGIGAAIGGLAGGKKGAAGGAAIGAAVGLTLVLNTRGEDIKFEPGAVFTLLVTSSKEENRD